MLLRPPVLLLIVLLVPPLVFSSPVDGAQETQAETTGSALPEKYAGLNPMDLVLKIGDVLSRLEAAATQAERAPLREELTELARALNEVDPSNDWLLFLKARSLSRSTRPGDAIPLLQRFIRTSTGQNEWRAHRLLGDLYVRQYPQLARESYERALQLKPGEPTVLVGLSQAMEQLGRLDEALGLIERAIASRPEAQYFGQKAVLHRSLNQPTQALKASNEGVRIARELHARHPQERATVELLDRLLAIRVEVLAAQGQREGSSPELALALAAALRERAENARVLWEFEVIAVLEAALQAEQTGDNLELLREYATALIRVGRLQDARSALQRVIDQAPDDRVARELLSRIESDSDT